MTGKKAQAVITINRDWCKCCDLCIELCPAGVFTRSENVGPQGRPEPLVTAPEKCVICRLCELSCPDIAITVREKSAGKETGGAKE